MSITYAGFSLLLEDEGYDLVNWISRNIDIESMRLFGDNSPDKAAGRFFSSKTAQDHEFPTGYMNWPGRPKFRINALYWPSGASRYAYGAFLTSGDTLVRIKEAMSGSQSNEFADLVLKDPNAAGSVTTSMHLLSARRITAASGKSLHLIALVDDRYLMDRQILGTIASVDGPSAYLTSEWDDVFTGINDSRTPSFTHESVDSTYLKADRVAIGNLRHESRAVSLDLAASSVGQRVVKQLNGTLEAILWGTSTTRNNANLELPLKIVAGGLEDDEIYPMQAPANVEVIFRKALKGQAAILSGADTTVGKFYKKTITAAAGGDLAAGETADTEHRIYSTAFDHNDLTETWVDAGDDQTELDLLALRIGLDYYASENSLDYDHVFCGLVNEWVSSGFDDYIVWEIGSLQDHTAVGQIPRGEYRASTRIISIPRDVGPVVMMQQHESFQRRIPAGVFLCRLTSGMSASSSAVDANFTATAKFLWRPGAPTDGETTDDDRTITIYDNGGRYKQAQTGDEFFIRSLSAEAPLGFDIICARQDSHQAIFVEVTLSGSLGGGSAAAAVLRFWQGTDPGSPVTIVDLCGFYGSASQGACFIACYDDIRDVYVIIDGLIAGDDPTSPDIRAFCSSGGLAGNGVDVPNFETLYVDEYSGLTASRYTLGGINEAVLQLMNAATGSQMASVLGFSTNSAGLQTSAPSVGEKIHALGEGQSVGWLQSTGGGAYLVDVQSQLDISQGLDVFFGAGDGDMNFSSLQLFLMFTDRNIKVGSHLFVTQINSDDVNTIDSITAELKWTEPGLCGTKGELRYDHGIVVEDTKEEPDLLPCTETEQGLPAATDNETTYPGC